VRVDLLEFWCGCWYVYPKGVGVSSRVPSLVFVFAGASAVWLLAHVAKSKGTGGCRIGPPFVCVCFFFSAKPLMVPT
jgi:hypothetical protein